MDTVRYQCEVCGDTEGWTSCGDSVAERFLVGAGTEAACAARPCHGFYKKVCPCAVDGGICDTCTPRKPEPGDAIPVAKLSAAVYASAAIHADAKGKKDFGGSIDGAGYKGSMDDPSKPPLSLVTRTFLWEVAAVLGIGATKYARGNWMRGMSFSETANGVLRHITSWLSGETHDPETGRNHLAHAACGLMFLLTFQEGPRKDEYARFDDRLVEGASA